MTVSMRQLTAAALALLATLAAGRAFAQEPTSPPPVVGGMAGVFGERGQIVISNDLVFDGPAVNLFHESHSTTGASSTTAFQLRPEIDYFISPSVSVGGVLGVVRASDNSTNGGSATTISLGARGGYNMPLTPMVSVWVRLGLSYERISFSGGGGPDVSAYKIPLSLFAAFLWHPIPHFFLGAGPAFATDLTSKVEGNDADKVTDIGITSVIGGYFGGP